MHVCLVSATTHNDEQYPQSLPRGGEDERLARTDTQETNTERIWTRSQGRTVQMTLTGEVATTVCPCGKVCKNVRGLRVHQARSKSCSAVSQTQRTENIPHETEEVASQESNHSTDDLFANESQQANVSNTTGEQRNQHDAHHPVRKDSVKWPRSNEKEWKVYDEDLEYILNSILQGPAEKKIYTLTTVAHNLGEERFKK